MNIGGNTENQPTTNCRAPTGHQNDCCTGFMDYGTIPRRWSECSVRDFEQYYVIRQWNRCMNKGKKCNLILNQ